MQKLLLIFLLIFSTQYVSAENFHWLTHGGEKAPDSKNQKSINGFGGWLIVTPDKDWAEKWNTPRENIPYFSEADEVVLGEELTILPFFANPKLDQDSKFKIICDIKVQKPDGSYSINEKGVSCAEGKLTIDPLSIFLTQTIIKYIGESGDPFGRWTVYFDITDSLRGVTIPLETSFKLVESKANKAP
jgi:hypothetical protein